MNTELRIQRGQLPEMIYTYLEEKGPHTLTGLANGMQREGSNLIEALKKLKAEGRVAQDEETKVWSALDKPPDSGEGDGTTPPSVDHIETAIRALKESGKSQRKLIRVRDMLAKVISVIDSE